MLVYEEGYSYGSYVQYMNALVPGLVLYCLLNVQIFVMWPIVQTVMIPNFE